MPEEAVRPALEHIRTYPLLPDTTALVCCEYKVLGCLSAMSDFEAFPAKAPDSPFTVAISGAITSYIVHVTVPSVNVVVPEVTEDGNEGAEEFDVPAVVQTIM